MWKDQFQIFSERVSVVSQSFQDIIVLADLSSDSNKSSSTASILSNQQKFQGWAKKFDIDFDPPFPDSLEQHIFKDEKRRFLVMTNLRMLSFELSLLT
ncbi:hypothetical protein ACHAP5_000888 [Fusarium lateritium]